MFTNGGTAECEVVGKRAIAYYNCQHVDIKTGCDAAIMEAINMFFNGGKLIKTALVQDGLKNIGGINAVPCISILSDNRHNP